MIPKCCFEASWALAQFFYADNTYISIISIKLPMEIFIWKAYSMYFERKMKRELKLNSDYLFAFITLDINAIWRMQYFFRHCLNKTVSEFNNFNIGAVNAMQKKNCLAAQIGRANEKFAFINAIAVSLFFFSFNFPAIQLFISTWKKIWLLFLSSHVYTALEFERNYFGILF